MKEVAEQMQSSYIELKDIAQEISGSVDNIEFDPNRLKPSIPGDQLSLSRNSMWKM